MMQRDDAVIRPATLADLDGVHALEQACFDTDAQSRRSLRYLISRARSDFLIVLAAGHVVADVVVLYRRNAGVARLYSIAVGDAARGRGLGVTLLGEAEIAAMGRGCHALRAEARQANVASRALFARAGYRERERLPGYYPARAGETAREDGIRLEKLLNPTE